MKEAIVHSTGALTIRDIEIPSPEAGQLLIKVAVSGTNPKDWKVPSWNPKKEAINQGDDIAGYVEQVGAGVLNFRKGDKVAAFHEMLSPHGSYGEYAIAWEHSTFHLTEETSFEEAATVPLAAMTAGLGLYQELNLPLPWNPATQKTPLVVYGGATAVGAFVIKFAILSNIHPIIAVAGRGAHFVEALIDRSKGDTIVDYRIGDEAVRKGITTASGGLPIHHVFDTVSEKGSHLNAGAAAASPAIIATVLPTQGDDQLPEGVTVSKVNVGSVHKPPPSGDHVLGDREFSAAFFPFIGRGLAQGWFKGHPYEVRPGGLTGLEGALRDLRDGVASAVKYVVRISETEL